MYKKYSFFKKKKGQYKKKSYIRPNRAVLCRDQRLSSADTNSPTSCNIKKTNFIATLKNLQKEKYYHIYEMLIDQTYWFIDFDFRKFKWTTQSTSNFVVGIAATWEKIQGKEKQVNKKNLTEYSLEHVLLFDYMQNTIFLNDAIINLAAQHLQNWKFFKLQMCAQTYI